MTRGRVLDVLKVLAIIAGFVAVSYVTQAHKAVLAEALGAGGAAGPVAFVLITAVLVVVVIPLDLVFVVPLGIALWGPAATALLSITGWTVGAAAAFVIARRFGRPLVVRIIGESRVAVIERHVPTSNLFWLVVLLRMCVPVDLLSYALGLASLMRWQSYLLATALGVSPFAFFFAYAGTLPLARELAALAAAFAFAGAVLVTVRRYRARQAGPGPGGDPSRSAPQ